MEQFRKQDRDPRKSILLETFAECRIFRNLSLGQIKEISSHATPISYNKGDLIFENGEPADYLYIVQDGTVKLHSDSPSGKALIFEISTLGGTLNGSAMSTKAYFMSARALTDVTVLRISRQEFFGFVAKYPNVAMELVHLLSSRLKIEYERMVAIQRDEVDRRVCQSLLALASRFGPKLSLKREELAEYAGITRETTIRVLSRLKKAGIISCSSRRREIVISDLAKLKSALEGPSTSSS